MLARKRRGLTKIELARRSNVATRTLYDIEAGLAIPTDETVVALSEALRFPTDFFYGDDMPLPAPEAASFRALRSMTAAKRDAALAAGAIALRVSEWIEKRFELPSPRVPDLRNYEPEAAAIALRDYWGLGERAIGNMVHLLESVGIRVFSLAEDRRVDAFSLWQNELPFVFLNTVKSAEHSRMDAAHELGHLVLHRHGVPWGRNIEKDAQAFAAAFLMPRGGIFAMPKLHVATLQHLVQLKKRWLVSASALAHRMHDLELLTDWNYRGLCIQLAKLGRTREPEGIARETSQVLPKVFGHADTPKSEAAKDLSLYQADIEALVFGLRAEPAPARGKTGPKASTPRPQLRIV